MAKTRTPEPTTTPRWQEYMDVDVLDPALRNAKAHDDAALADSMGTFGFLQPVVLDERTGRLVAGHGRVARIRAARDAGETPPEGVLVDGSKWRVPVTRGWESRDDHHAEAAGLALNKVGEGLWDDTVLHATLADISASVGFTGTGFSAADLADLAAMQEEIAGSAAAPVAPVGDGPRYGPIDENTGMATAEPTLGERLDVYKEKSIRSVVLDFELPIFQWWVANAGVARDLMGVEDNTTLVLRLVAEKLGIEPPSMEMAEGA